MIRAIAKRLNLKLIDIRLSQEDPTTINGFPCLDGGRSKYLPPEIFPLEGDDLAEGYDGWLVFFDELPSAPRSVQAAAYKIILDKVIGQTPIHEKCFIAAAGNLTTDNAIVNEMGTALKSRMTHIHVESQPDNYLDYAMRAGYDMRITAYLNYQKHNVNTFRNFEKSSDETFACERTWEFVSEILKVSSPNQQSPISDDLTTLLQGTVGSTALEFVQFTYAFKDLPSFSEIISNPLTVAMPEKPAVRWLLTSMLVGNATVQNTPTLMRYVDRMPKEFQFVFVKMLWGKEGSDAFLDLPCVQDKFDDIGDLLLA